jgi:hypothetical protein
LPQVREAQNILARANAVPDDFGRMAELLPFAQRAGFVAGQAKSGTTLLVALLDNHPELLVLPEETAYFPTVLTKYGKRSRREQFDYLTKESLSNVVFGGPCKWGKRDYSYFPTAEFYRRFETLAFAPGNGSKDLLVLMLEAYAATIDRSLDSITRWVEKTPANRRYLPQIRAKFPHAKILLTLRDPRAIFAAQIALEKTRQLRRFSIYYCISHWREAAKLALRASRGDDPGSLVVRYEQLILETEKTMEKVCAFLGVRFPCPYFGAAVRSGHYPGPGFDLDQAAAFAAEFACSFGPVAHRARKAGAAARGRGFVLNIHIQLLPSCS